VGITSSYTAMSWNH